ncbi:putative EH domain-containing protein 1-like isoform 1 [Capsicum annuum]|nr:putative EH domain-containing protein 1-like isoform 1 [Capsicum annuum]
MMPQRMKKVMTDNPKTLAHLIDLVNLPSTLREFMGQSQTSRLGCFKRVWSYIKENNLQCDLNLLESRIDGLKRPWSTYMALALAYYSKFYKQKQSLTGDFSPTAASINIKSDYARS